MFRAGNSVGICSKKLRSQATIAVTGADMVFATLPSFSAGRSLSFAAALFTYPSHIGDELPPVGAIFASS